MSRATAATDRACAVAPVGSRYVACSCGRRSLWSRHASFAQTVLACSETGASVTPWPLTATARQLSSQAAELALRGMPRPFSATAAWQARCCHAVNQSAPRRPQRPSGPALRGFGSREGGTSGAFGGGCQPRRATDVSASETWWSERVRAATGPRAREDGAEPALAPWWSERVRAATGPRAREDGAEPTLAPWWSERVRAAMGPRAREDGAGSP